MPRNQPRYSHGRSAIARRAINTNSTNGMMYQGTCIAQDGTKISPCRDFGGVKKGGAHPSATGFMRARPWQTSVNAKHKNYVFRINKQSPEKMTLTPKAINIRVTAPTVNKCISYSDCDAGYHCQHDHPDADKLTGCMKSSDMVEDIGGPTSINMPLGNKPIYIDNLSNDSNNACTLANGGTGKKFTLNGNGSYCCANLTIDGSCADSVGLCHIDTSATLCSRHIPQCPSGSYPRPCLNGIDDISHVLPDWLPLGTMTDKCLGHGKTDTNPITSKDMTGGWQWLKQLPCKKCVARSGTKGTECGTYIDEQSGEPTDECTKHTECKILPNEPICLDICNCNNDGLNSSSMPHKCVWWGRGVIQTTGRCNYGKLNNALTNMDLLDGDNLCTNPYRICKEKGAGPLPWHAGFFFWINGVQGFGTTLSQWNNKGWPKEHAGKLQDGFIKLFTDISNLDSINNVIENFSSAPVDTLINSLSGIVNRGCPANNCPGSGRVDGLTNRKKYFNDLLTIFNEVNNDSFKDKTYIDIINEKSSALTKLVITPPATTPPTISLYDIADCIKVLTIADASGYNGPTFFNGNEKTNNLVGIINFCAFLAQCRQETLQYGACDENNWSMDATWLYKSESLPNQIVLDGHTALGWTDPSYAFVPQKYPVTSACGQLGQIYYDYDCSDACPAFVGKVIPGNTQAHWANAPAPIGSSCSVPGAQAPGCNFPPQKYWKNLIPNCYGPEASNCTLIGLTTCGISMERPPDMSGWCLSNKNRQWVTKLPHDSSGCLISYDNEISYKTAGYVKTIKACKALTTASQITHWCNNPSI